MREQAENSTGSRTTAGGYGQGLGAEATQQLDTVQHQPLEWPKGQSSQEQHQDDPDGEHGHHARAHHDGLDGEADQNQQERRCDGHDNHDGLGVGIEVFLVYRHADDDREGSHQG